MHPHDGTLRMGSGQQMNLVVVGGGAAGVELAFAFRQRYSCREVSVVHGGPPQRFLCDLGPKVATVCLLRLQSSENIRHTT